MKDVWHVSLTEPTLMGGPKGMEERCRVTVATIDGIFVVNRNFLNKYSTNKKILKFNYTYAVQFSLESVRKWVTS